MTVSNVAISNYFVNGQAKTSVHPVQFSPVDVPFLAWSSTTFLASTNHFDDDNAYAMDIHQFETEAAGWQAFPRKLYGPKLGPDGALENLRRGAQTGVARNVLGRLRAWGPDIEVGAYCCALPFEHLRHDVRVLTRPLEAAYDFPTNEVQLDFGPVPARLLAWVGLSVIEPTGKFNHNNAVAIDLVRRNGQLGTPMLWNGVLLGPHGQETNVFQGCYVGEARTLTARLRVFDSPDLIVAGYVCALYYPG